MSDEIDKKEPPIKTVSGKKIFLSKAYLVEDEPGVFVLFRNILEEGFDKAKGKPVREKMGPPFPLGVFRECREGEQPDLRTVHPTTMRELLLKSMADD